MQYANECGTMWPVDASIVAVQIRCFVFCISCCFGCHCICLYTQHNFYMLCVCMCVFDHKFIANNNSLLEMSACVNKRERESARLFVDFGSLILLCILPRSLRLTISMWYRYVFFLILLRRSNIKSHAIGALHRAHTSIPAAAINDMI